MNECINVLESSIVGGAQRGWGVGFRGCGGEREPVLEALRRFLTGAPPF